MTNTVFIFNAPRSMTNKAGITHRHHIRTSDGRTLVAFIPPNVFKFACKNNQKKGIVSSSRSWQTNATEDGVLFVHKFGKGTTEKLCTNSLRRKCANREKVHTCTYAPWPLLFEATEEESKRFSYGKYSNSTALLMRDNFCQRNSLASWPGLWQLYIQNCSPGSMKCWTENSVPGARRW